MVSNKGLNSKEALDESTAINSSVMLSGARRVKEIADRLDTQDYSIDPQNSDRGRLVVGDEASPRVHLEFPASFVLNRLRLKIHKILEREPEGKDARRATLLVTQPRRTFVA